MRECRVIKNNKQRIILFVYRVHVADWWEGGLWGGGVERPLGADEYK